MASAVLLPLLLPPACPATNSLLELPSALLSDAACLRASASKLLGYAVVLGAGAVKLPQIAKLLSAKSAAGLSFTTYLVESFGYAYNLAYHARAGYPLSTYGDFVLLGAQNLLLLLLMYAYSGAAGKGAAVVLAYVLFVLASVADYGTTGVVLVPLQLLEALCGLNLVIVLASRVPQIYANYRRQSTGNLSLATCLGLFGGAVARVMTTLQEVHNATILAGYLASALFNGIIVAQIVYYEYAAAAAAAPKRGGAAERARQQKLRRLRRPAASGGGARTDARRAKVA